MGWTNARITKTVSVMVISTRSEDATEMTKIFEQTFRNPSKMTFISKSYLSTLDSISRLQFVESQIAYTRQNCSIFLRHIKNLNVPSIHVSTDNQPIMVYDCINDIKDYQGQPLFTEILPPVNNTIKVHMLNTNLQLALEWERNSIKHIARKINRHYYSEVFDIPFNKIQYIEPSPDEWLVPAPPEINFLVPQRKTWANILTIIQNDTINTSNHSNKETRSVSPSISTTTNQIKKKYGTTMIILPQQQVQRITLIQTIS
jgi:hypothetical protein